MSVSAHAATSRELCRVNYAFMTFPADDYTSNLTVFPGSNAHAPWGLGGPFTLGARVYRKGTEAARIEPKSCDETGFIQLDFETPLRAAGGNLSGVGILELDSYGDVPIEMYLAHVHRKTGVYFAYPALMFMGDKLYPEAHVEQMENTLFWPGFQSWASTEYHLAVLNPNALPMGFEVTLWDGHGGHHTQPAQRVGARDWQWIKLDEILPKQYHDDTSHACSLSVTAQFKLIAYMILINRELGMITSADHLHPYQLH